MKKLIHTVRNHIILIGLGAFIGVVAILLVHLLPTKPMWEHVYYSMDMIEKEFYDEVLVDGNNATLTGSFTDSLMLEYAIYSNEEHSLLEQVLHMYRKESYYNEDDLEGWQPGQSLKDYVEGMPQPREISYSRYWHGYLVILKPLLMLTSLSSIRLFNAALQLILTGFVIIAFCKKGAESLAKAFLVSLPFMFFVSTFASLSLSICFYIMLLALLVQLKWDDVLHRENLYAWFFLIIGMVTSYFDFLTYPLVTLAYPLCVYLYFHEDKLLQNIKKMIWYSAEWFVGYGGMWACKWILTDLLTASTTIQDAFNTILNRTQSAENASRIGGFFEVAAKNMQVYANWCYLLLGFVIVMIIFLKAIRVGHKGLAACLHRGIAFAALSCYPFIWYFATQNHSEQHWQFTCRILAISVFAMLAGVARIINKE